MDVAFNMLKMKIRSKSEDYLQKAETGYSRMKNHEVAICALVRDCKIQLERNISTINKLKNCFSKSHVVIVENDSKDGTKELLNRWAKEDDDVHAISEDIGVKTIPDVKEGQEVYPWYSTHRIKLMASYRNKYLAFIEKKAWALDYVMVIDLDLEYISIDGVANSFGQDIKWDAITSNGIKHFREGSKYYDTYAFRELGDTAHQTRESIYTYQNLLTGLEAGMIMIRVVSGFNGLAIYRAEAIKGLRYRAEENNDPQVESLSEHVLFHQDMAKNGHGFIYINPSQVVYYNQKIPRLAKRIKNKLLRTINA
jgi:glycosyltransferase involved in cell wall biosynthesis